MKMEGNGDGEGQCCKPLDKKSSLIRKAGYKLSTWTKETLNILFAEKPILTGYQERLATETVDQSKLQKNPLTENPTTKMILKSPL